jgi:hypothetical protein
MLKEDAIDRGALLETEVDDSDFAFIVGFDGELKAVFMPCSTDYAMPEKVKKLFLMFGISDPENVEMHTIH